MVTLKGGYRLAALLAIILVAGLATACLYGEDESVAYLPRNEDMQTVYKDYQEGSKRLPEISCSAAADLFNEYRTCINCVTEIKSSCPDCCLILTHSKRAVRCSAQDSSDYDCCEVPFDSTNCSAIATSSETDWDSVCRSSYSIANENHYQNLGCPAIKPDGNCREFGSDWLCTESGLHPDFTGCACRQDAKEECPAGSGSKCASPCAHISSYYTVTPVRSAGCPYSGFGWGGLRDCYKYTPTPEFASCVNKCLTYANDYDTCNNRLECCKRDVCSELDVPGYQNCNIASCQERINDPTCDTYTLADCSLIQKNAQDCLTGGFLAGGCSKCFRTIDDDFYYRFIARSRENITVIWQISTTPYDITNPLEPTYVTNSSTYFFSKIAVFEVSPSGAEKQVYESMLHQKSLEAAFSIFCATHIPNDVLEAGYSYVIKVYYFLPELTGIDLEVQVNSLRLIVIRTRQ